ncbi:beta-glucan synthesis-associated protein KRE6 [Candida albicans P87]|nr:beta-glucan synthesis-associated protein KRE6 [Candida albicans GC75]KGU10427.1 beta-glucan synthesis-associated protein KRE6 [Candida albicans P87]KGU31401.1 beta-glucan synthesis-associated protein KRE6 [Candida albicans P75063]KHC70311.1 beta-glucan synthesis-associated protein KRE6 [Candida albicans P75016]
MASQRDLTSNNPHFHISSSRNNTNDDFNSDHNPRNPFGDEPEEEEEEELDSASFSSSSQNNQPHHPFATSNQTSSINNLHSTNSIRNEAEYGKPFQAYSGYYSNGGSSSYLNQEGVISDESRLLSSGNNNNNNRDVSSVGGGGGSGDNRLNPTSPAEFDRYPSMAGSRVVSSTSLVSFNNPSNMMRNHHQHQPHLGSSSSPTSSSMNNDSISDKSTSPFPNDFSPFGGYPASSFPLSIDEKEPDDYLHNPDPVQDAEYEKNRFMHDLKNMDKRSLGGLIGFIILFIAALAVFIILPALTYSGATNPYHPESYEVLTKYSYPMLSAIRMNLVDPDTPESAYKKKAKDGSEWVLVFSDEFDAEGRTFYEGDDQFFTAPDIHYDATKDLEWYDPDAVTTANGTLNLRMDAYKNHNLFYRSGMVQSWNQLCYTQGHLEISARLPNYGNVTGLWPGLWSMGNLGRPGYLGSTDGVWPYSYDSCDAGITPNQSSPDGISYLPGQRLNKCTCPGELHPNRGVGRGAPEIDVIEGEVMTDSSGKKENCGVASQSLQLAPMDIWYIPDYNWVEIYNFSVSTMNTYTGGPFQQALSATTMLNVTWYEFGDNAHNFQTYGYEYLNDPETGYLRWFVGDDPTLTVYSQALHPDGNIGWRPLSKEPMSLILNLGISNNWAYIDWPSISFPVTFRIDYVRVYQPPDQINVGCDPTDFPTYDYIQQHLNLYENANITSFEDGGYKFPKNSLIGC